MFVSFNIETGNGGAILFGAGAFSLIVGIGLFNLSTWSRYLAIGGYILNIIVCFSEGNIIGLGIAIVILSYLFSKNVKEAFAKTSIASEEFQNDMPASLERA